MATKNYTFQGKCKWAQVLHPSKKYGKYSIQFYPSEETRKAIKAIGTKAGLKEDGDGFYYTFRRDPEAKFGGGPVKVTDMQGQPFDKLIGNGSTVEINLEVYDYKNDFGEGKGTRLNSVKVLHHIPYVREETSVEESNATALPITAVPVSAPEPVKTKRPF